MKEIKIMNMLILLEDLGYTEGYEYIQIDDWGKYIFTISNSDTGATLRYSDNKSEPFVRLVYSSGEINLFRLIRNRNGHIGVKRC